MDAALRRLFHAGPVCFKRNHSKAPPKREREKKEKIMMEGWWATTVATAPSFGRLEECSGKLGCFFCVELKSGLLKLFLLFFSETEAKKVMN